MKRFKRRMNKRARTRKQKKIEMKKRTRLSRKAKLIQIRTRHKLRREQRSYTVQKPIGIEKAWSF